jgi:hypothetical protein
VRSFRAAARLRSSARGRALRHCVRTLGCSTVLPLASSLPSTASAVCVCSGRITLFGRLLGTLELSDSLPPCITVVPLSGAPCGPDGDGPGQRQGLPGPAHDVSVHARGLRPRRVRRHLAKAVLTVSPSAGSERVGTQE